MRTILAGQEGAQEEGVWSEEGLGVKAECQWVPDRGVLA